MPEPSVLWLWSVEPCEHGEPSILDNEPDLDLAKRRSPGILKLSQLTAGIPERSVVRDQHSRWFSRSGVGSPSPLSTDAWSVPDPAFSV